MPDIQYSSTFNPGFILLSDEFILQHMPKANGTYVKVYLYAYQSYINRTAGLSTSGIAAKLSMIESDVLEALRYWQNEKLLTLEQSDAGIRLSFTEGGRAPVPPTPGPGSKKDTADTQTQPVSKVVRLEQKPTYSPEELAVYQANPRIAGLFSKAQKSLGTPLSPPNLSMLFSFYDYYRLPVDVVEYLIDYCTANGGRSLRYMERVAQDWSDQNLTTVEAAKEYTARFTAYRPIMNALHLKGARPSDSDLEFINRWLNDYQMPVELITEACTRTWQRTGQASLPYADSILDRWHAQGIQTLEDVARADESFARSHGISSGAGTPDYTTHSEWDYDALERLAQNRLYSERRS